MSVWVEKVADAASLFTAETPDQVRGDTHHGCARLPRRLWLLATTNKGAISPRCEASGSSESVTSWRRELLYEAITSLRPTHRPRLQVVSEVNASCANKRAFGFTRQRTRSGRATFTRQCIRCGRATRPFALAALVAHPAGVEGEKPFWHFLAMCHRFPFYLCGCCGDTKIERDAGDIRNGGALLHWAKNYGYLFFAR